MKMTRPPPLRSSETCGRDNRRQLLILPMSHGKCQHGETHRVLPRRRGWAGGGVWAGTPEGSWMQRERIHWLKLQG